MKEALGLVSKLPSTVSTPLSPDLLFCCLLFVFCANPPNYFAHSKVELQNVVVYHSIHRHFSYTFHILLIRRNIKDYYKVCPR